MLFDSIMDGIMRAKIQLQLAEELFPSETYQEEKKKPNPEIFFTYMRDTLTYEIGKAKDGTYYEDISDGTHKKMTEKQVRALLKRFGETL
jgi:hypothetical protein